MSDHPQYPSYPGDDGSGAADDRPPPSYGQTPPAQGYGQVPPGGQPPPVYGQVPPGYGYGYPMAPAQPANTKSVVALVLGITSILFCYLGVLIGPAAIILAVQGRREIELGPAAQRLAPSQPSPTQVSTGMATAGLVTGIIGTVIWGLIVALTIIGIAVE